MALRNDHIMVRCYDPNFHILEYLKRSLKSNDLTDRVKLINAAVSDHKGKARMNLNKGSYAAHLSVSGTEVEVEDFKDILGALKNTETLFKIDVEGFETILIPILIASKNQLHVFVIEMHPAGMNDISDPEKNLSVLLNSGFIVETVSGKRIYADSQIENWENIVCRFST